MRITAAILVAAVSLASSVLAQDGTPNIPAGGSAGASYSCDPNACKLPDCLCASTSPPNGLKPEDVPQVSYLQDDDGSLLIAIVYSSSLLSWYHSLSPSLLMTLFKPSLSRQPMNC